MSDEIAKGTWVEIQSVVLTPAQRAPQVPEEPRQVPLEMRVRGFLTASAAPGEIAEIITAAGRRLRGTLTIDNPPYSHGFGPPVPELSTIGAEVRKIVAAGEKAE
jgi:hypothetical protein